MKKFFGEFKKFITRGNVVDLAVGVIIGSAFTAIVSAVTDGIFMPLINWLIATIFGANSLSNIFTYLKKVEVDGVIDLTASIYINWGALIAAVIKFLLIALVLFLIVKAINNISEKRVKLLKKAKKYKLTKEDKAEMKANGKNPRSCADVKEYVKEKEEKIAAEKKAEEEKAAAEAEEAKKHTTEALLEQIKDLLEKQAK